MITVFIACSFLKVYSWFNYADKIILKHTRRIKKVTGGLMLIRVGNLSMGTNT